MKFKCVFVNKRTNEIINKDFTVAQIDKYLDQEDAMLVNEHNSLFPQKKK